ncbi:hypothetical protein ABEB36_011671 [Hypothenemus hampei]
MRNLFKESMEDLTYKSLDVVVHRAKVHEKTPHNIIMNVVQDGSPRIELNDFEIPDRERLQSLIRPLNPEMQALLSVVSFAKFQRLNIKEIEEDFLRKRVNLRATNTRQFVSSNEIFNNKVNFQLNWRVNTENCREELKKEIQDYHENHEKDKLSLLLEIINSNLKTTFGETSRSDVETSDLGTSILEESRKSSYLDVLNKPSFGLTENIESFIIEAHNDLRDIKESFQESEKKINNLMTEAKALENDLRQTAFLSNFINLLNGDLEKASTMKLPFRMFQNKENLNFNNIL